MSKDYPPSPGPGQNANPSRVLMYCHDGFGLGHLRRTTTLARRLREAHPDSSVLLAVGSSALPFWKDVPGLDYVKLPSIRKVAQDRWSARSLPISPDMAHGIRASMLREVVRRYRPHLFVADYLPIGPAGELIPALDAAEQLGTRCVLGLRDIVDAPDTVRELWRSHGTMSAIEKWYDQVLVYGERDIFDAVSTYGFSKTVASRATYCGYVVDDSPHESPARVRSRLNMQTGKLVLVTGGGGADAAPLVRAMLSGLRENAGRDTGGNPGFDTLVVLGPLMDRDTRNAIREEAAGLPVTLRTEVGDARKYVAAADVVVTMGGYNSLMEVASAGKRAVVVPRRGPSQEQKMRAALFASRGWVRAASDMDSVTGSELVGLIRKALDAPGRSPWQGLRLDGGDKAVSALVSCLLSPRRRPCLPTRPEDWAFPGPRASALPAPPATYPEGAPLHMPS